MTRNVKPLDRTVRVILGMTLMTLALGFIPRIWGVLGLVLLVTGLLGWCPIYRLIGREPVSSTHR